MAPHLNKELKLIAILDKVFSEESCNAIVALYEQFKKNAHEWRGTKPLNLTFLPKEFETFVVSKIETEVQKFFNNAVYDWGEIVKWAPSNYQPLHLDTSSNETILTSITYLNEDFVGGETYFEDGTIVKPVTGRTLIFNGMQYVHGVKEIIDGVRWTVPIWYKKRGE